LGGGGGGGGWPVRPEGSTTTSCSPTNVAKVRVLPSPRRPNRAAGRFSRSCPGRRMIATPRLPPGRPTKRHRDVRELRARLGTYVTPTKAAASWQANSAQRLSGRAARHERPPRPGATRSAGRSSATRPEPSVGPACSRIFLLVQSRADARARTRTVAWAAGPAGTARPRGCNRWTEADRLSGVRVRARRRGDADGRIVGPQAGPDTVGHRTDNSAVPLRPTARWRFGRSLSARSSVLGPRWRR